MPEDTVVLSQEEPPAQEPPPATLPCPLCAGGTACGPCYGSGHLWSGALCPWCGGSGKCHRCGGAGIIPVPGFLIFVFPVGPLRPAVLQGRQ